MKQQIEDVAAQHYEVAMAFGVSYDSFRAAVESGVGLGMDKVDKRLEQLLMSLQATLQSLGGLVGVEDIGTEVAHGYYLSEAEGTVEEALAIIRLEE